MEIVCLTLLISINKPFVSNVNTKQENLIVYDACSVLLQAIVSWILSLPSNVQELYQPVCVNTVILHKFYQLQTVLHCVFIREDSCTRSVSAAEEI